MVLVARITRSPRIYRLLTGALLLATLWGCGSDDMVESGSSFNDAPQKDSGMPGFGGAGGGGTTPLPPEEELESSFLSPVATGRIVWIANPTSGRVAFLDAATLSVKLIEAGNGPTHLAPLPPQDGADRTIVLNVLSLDATVLSAKDGVLSSRTLPVPSGGNSWAIAPSGRFAIAWTDTTKVKEKTDPLDGFQDLTVLDLENDKITSLSVGYRPVTIAFSQDSSHAFVVTQDGIAVLSLGETSTVTKNFPLTDDPLGATTRDVAITPDGSLALVRMEKATAITTVKLDSGKRSQIELDGEVTDLDLAPGGKIAVAVVRELGKVTLLKVPEIADDSEARTELIVGSGENVVGSASLASESPVAFLYSNAALNPLLTTLDVSAATPSPHSILLRAPVGAVFPTKDASAAVVIHTKGPQDSATQYKAALSVLRVTDALPPKIVGLEASVTAVAVGPSGEEAIIAIGDEKSGPWKAELVKFGPQQVKEMVLPSPPIAVGIVPEAKRGYVAQKHPEGRITFVDLETGEARTLTGFELAAQVVYGDKK